MAAVAAVAVAAAAIVLLAGGDESSAELRALQDDPMAEYAPPGGELVDTELQSEGTTLGKPHLARSSRLFGLDAADAERAVESTLAAADAAGWTLEGEPKADAFGGAVGFAGKQLSTGKARLTVSLLTDARLLGDQVSPPALQIQLEHLGR